MQAVLTEAGQYLEGDELVVCLLSPSQWQAHALGIHEVDMLVEETKALMDISVHYLSSGHLLICVRSTLVTHDHAEETVRLFLALMSFPSITELI